MSQTTAPAWESISEDVLCPMCEYNLRGLAEARCPECGHRFEWDNLLDPAKRKHRFLFEHHPHHNLWSFFKTFAGGLRPKKFWTSLLPSQPSRPGRLILYGILIVLLLCLIWGGIVVTELIGYGAYDWFYLTVALTRDVVILCDYLLLSFVAWPVMTFLILQVFGDSMRKAKVKPIHVLRCVIYSFDAIGWWAILLSLGAAAGVVIDLLDLKRGVAISELWPEFIGWLVIPLILCVWWRLWRAYRHYMRMEHSWGVVLASQIIFLLIWMNVISWIGPQ